MYILILTILCAVTFGQEVGIAQLDAENVQLQRTNSVLLRTLREITSAVSEEVAIGHGPSSEEALSLQVGEHPGGNCYIDVWPGAVGVQVIGAIYRYETTCFEALTACKGCFSPSAVYNRPDALKRIPCPEKCSTDVDGDPNYIVGVGHVKTTCNDQSNWKATSRRGNVYECIDYKRKWWCKNGGVGSHWNDDWNWIRGNNGMDARQACCVCGGGKAV